MVEHFSNTIVASAGLTLIGFLFLATGILVITRKRMGIEEARIMPTIKGKPAIVAGIIQILVGSVCLLLAAIFWKA